MDEMFSRVWNDFVARTTGPMWFRLIIQPAIAVAFGVRAGLRNARRDPSQSPPARTLDPEFRRVMFRQALRDVGKVLVVGVGLDAAFQLIALRAFYPLEALIVGFLLVALPYQIVRSVVAWRAPKR
jgi:hypothetical protein